MWWDDSEKRRRIGAGWEEAGRLASESASEKYVYPRMAPLISAA